MIFVVITATIGGLQIFTEPKLFNPSSSVPGGPEREYQTTVLYLWDLAFNRGDFGRASAVAWMLFLIIILIGLVNFFLSGSIASSAEGGSRKNRRQQRIAHKHAVQMAQAKIASNGTPGSDGTSGGKGGESHE
jgi:cellobiose transport system permease protein